MSCVWNQRKVQAIATAAPVTITPSPTGLQTIHAVSYDGHYAVGAPQAYGRLRLIDTDGYLGTYGKPQTIEVSSAMVWQAIIVVLTLVGIVAL